MAVLRVLFLNWRDTRHPEGGGSEVYVENVALPVGSRGPSGHDLLRHVRGALADEMADGVRFVRAGTKLGVYREAVLRMRRRAFGELDVIIDVQNGIPFMSRAVAGPTPVVVLVHHVHRSSGRWSTTRCARRSDGGSSRCSHRGCTATCTYVAVSDKTARNSVNWAYSPAASTSSTTASSRPRPGHRPFRAPAHRGGGQTGPHKRVEHVLRAAAILRRRHPDLRISVVGDGWWSQRLQQVAQTLGVSDLVDFLGFVDEKTKHRVYASAWVLALPSLKEGWGIVVMEAATHGVPAVAYREAGGVAESIVHEQTGCWWTATWEDFAQALDAVLSNPAHRDRLGESARIRSEEFTWAATTASFAGCARRSCRQGRRVSGASAVRTWNTTVGEPAVWISSRRRR